MEHDEHTMCSYVGVSKLSFPEMSGLGVGLLARRQDFCLVARHMVPSASKMGFNKGDGQFIASTAFGFLTQEESDAIRQVVSWPFQKACNGVR